MSEPEPISVAVKRCNGPCGLVKPAHEFHRKGTGLRARCKVCTLAENAIWQSQHLGHLRKYRADYYAAHAEQIREKVADWAAANPERRRASQRRYKAKHRDRILTEARTPTAKAKRAKRWRAYKKQRRRTDPGFRIQECLRASLASALKRAHTRKTTRTFELVGCSPQALVQHLEAKFLPGMSWERRGEIHIDHIRPCDSFDLTDPAQQRECFHYTNLQPLWAADNIRKSNTYVPIA